MGINMSEVGVNVAEVIKHLENLRRWLVPKIEWSLVMLGMLGIGYLVISALINMLGGKSSSSKGSSGVKFMYSTLPEVCYCHDCGFVIDMKKYGLYGKHCREIVCPKCGSRNVWRRPK